MFSRTCFDGSNRRKESNGIHDALSTLKASRSQDPCCGRVNDEHIKEKSTQAGKVVSITAFTHVFLCLERFTTKSMGGGQS
jgi:hypothetical protein